MNSQFEKAKFFYQKGKYAKAKDLCLRACKSDKNNVESRVLLGKIYLQSSESEQAVRLFNNAIDINPQLSEAFSGLGQAYLNLNNDQKSEDYFKKALHLNNANLDARLGLADVLIKKKQFIEAEKILNYIIGQQPKHIESLCRLGQTKFLSNNLIQAESLFKQVLEISPKHKQSNYLLASILRSNGYLEKSIEHLKRVVIIDPKFLSAYLELGDLLIIVGNPKEAINFFNKALKLNSNSIEAASGLASALNRIGDYKKAYSKLHSFIENEIFHPGVAKSFLQICNKMNLCEEAIGYMEKTLQAPDISDAAKSDMRYMLAGLYDKNRQFDKAFRHYKQANDFKTDNYSPIEYGAMIKSIIDVFTQTQISKLSCSSNLSDKPVFIMGMPRSGTSLTEQILSCHDRVFGAGELRAIGDEINKIGAKYGSHNKYPNFIPNINKELIEIASNNYLEFIESVSSGEDYVTDKMPHNFLYLGVISLMFPNAHFIHCKRNPRDICLSIYFQNFHGSHSYATRLENIIEHYKDYTRLMDHWKLVLNVPIFEVQYEELVNEQESVTRKMLDFVGLEWDEKCLDFHKSKRSVATSSQNQVNKRIYSSSMERWKNYANDVADIFEKMGV